MSTQANSNDSTDDALVESDVLTDDIWINDDGHVEGSAYVFDSENGYDVSGVVHSYDYEQHGEQRTNHVPRAVLTRPDGTILKEVSDHDSRHPEKAIERAANSAEWLYENAEQFTDD
ncbi:hypothetical protein EXE44_05115 [Halorubrum sp. SS7]|uniref:hypothetical protein n=1 Tax=Halorubrum sp. SS7 TaxID=2518119 RepID=UPI0010F7C17E|nr:hypothetical protein [Halorubrum sp. SS7]TKX58928.1 hypothetical protein EXE44_05115 [Halorubrum sp. SS7]